MDRGPCRWRMARLPDRSSDTPGRQVSAPAGGRFPPAGALGIRCGQSFLTVSTAVCPACQRAVLLASELRRAPVLPPVEPEEKAAMRFMRTGRGSQRAFTRGPAVCAILPAPSRRGRF